MWRVIRILLTVLIMTGFPLALATPASAGGGGWTHVGPSSEIDTLAVDPANDQRLYAGGPGGLWKTTDGGSTWQQVSAAPAGQIAVSAFPPAPSLWRALAAMASAGRSARMVAPPGTPSAFRQGIS